MRNIFSPIFKKQKLNKGLTLIELVIVMGIILMLFGFMGISLVRNQRIASVNSIRDGLFSDMASQQTKAMNGAGGASGTNFGIHFLSDKYILFKGSTYNQNDNSNFNVDLGPELSFINVYFPNSSIIFASGSGEIIGFVDGQNTIQIQDANGAKTETITINKYGVVTDY